MKMSQDDLRSRVALHLRWLERYDDGVQLDLTGADLTGANLTGANLREADLTEADLTGANLTGANLSNAVLSDTNLTGADLRGASLWCANLRSANLRDTDLRGFNVPFVPNIDAAILEALGDNPNRLNMGSWHTCKTTHCRAGWAITLAGEAGQSLERQFGSGVAGALIYAVSRPGRRIPNFYASNADALADIRESAAA